MAAPESRASESSPAGRRAQALAAGAVALAGAAVYAGSLRAPFVFDDLHSIVRDPAIGGFASALHPIEGSGANGRPVVALSLALNHALGGLDVAGYRAFNVAVHVLTALALLGLVRRCLLALGSRAATGVAFGSALLFVVHPLATDALDMVVTRNEALMALFYLAALYAAARGFASPRPAPWFAAAVAAGLLAVGSKENAASLPLAVWLLDRTFFAGSFRAALARHKGFYAALLLPWAWLAWLTAGAVRGASVGFEASVPPLRYARVQLDVVARYLRLALWPDDLVIDYGDWSVWRGLRGFGIGPLLTLAALAAGAWAVVRRRPAGLPAFVFFAVLAPTSSFLPISNEVAAEHRMYLPLAAVVVLLVALVRRALARLAEPRAARVASGVLLALAASALGARTVARNAQYLDPVVVWEGAVHAVPTNARASWMLGDALLARGEPERALEAWRFGLKTSPEHPELHARAAALLHALGRDEEAREHETFRARSAGPLERELAAAMQRVTAGDRAGGVAALRALLAAHPEHAPTRARLAQVLATSADAGTRRPDEAVQLAEALCAAMDPANPAYLDVLASAYAAADRFDDAARAARQARDLALAHGRQRLADVLAQKTALFESGRAYVDPGL